MCDKSVNVLVVSETYLYFPFVEMLRQSNGKYTATHLHRIGILAGQLGMKISEMFEGATGGTTQRKEESQVVDVAEFVRLYKDDNLVQTIPGRKLKDNPMFELDTEVKDCDLFMERVHQLALEVDLNDANFYEPPHQ